MTGILKGIFFVLVIFLTVAIIKVGTSYLDRKADESWEQWKKENLAQLPEPTVCRMIYEGDSLRFQRLINGKWGKKELHAIGPEFANFELLMELLE